jgi:uncharacterized protein
MLAEPPIQGNADNARRLFEKSAALGHGPSSFAVAFMLEHGHTSSGCDDADAQAWFERAAAQDNPEALNELGVRYAIGLGEVIVDSARARDLFLRAAVLGDADGQFNVAAWHIIAGEKRKAFPWLKAAAKQRHAGASHQLGCILLRSGTANNDERAIQMARSLFARAAVKLHAEAWTASAVMLHCGIGQEPDPVRAVSSFRMAAKRGSLTARRALRQLDRLGKPFLSDPMELITGDTAYRSIRYRVALPNAAFKVLRLRYCDGRANCSLEPIRDGDSDD